MGNTASKMSILSYLVCSRLAVSEDNQKSGRDKRTTSWSGPYFFSLSLSLLRPCYTKQFFLQLATQQTCNTPFCNCNCCVASCKKSRTTLYFSQRCETSCLRVTSPLQLATQFCQNGPIRAHLSQDVGDLARPPSCLLLYALQVAKKVANV